jgi:hypothetical protein
MDVIAGTKSLVVSRAVVIPQFHPDKEGFKPADGHALADASQRELTTK